MFLLTNEKINYSVKGKPHFYDTLLNYWDYISALLDLYDLYLCLNQRTGCARMNTPQDLPPNEKSPVHFILCSENWEDLMSIAVTDHNITPIESKYSDVCTQDTKRSYSDGPHSQCRMSRKKPKRVKKNWLYSSAFLSLIQWWCRISEYSSTIELKSEDW